MASTIHNLVSINKNFKTNLNYICKLLKCVATLEEKIDVNSSSSDLYRKVECKYSLFSILFCLKNFKSKKQAYIVNVK